MSISSDDHYDSNVKYSKKVNEREARLKELLAFPKVAYAGDIENELQTTPKPNLEEKKTVHMALIDSADENLADSEVDYPSGKLPKRKDPEYAKKKKELLDAEKMKERRIRKYQLKYPFAKVKNLEPSYVEDLITKKRANYMSDSKCGKYGVSRSAKALFRDMQKSARQVKRRTERLEYFKELYAEEEHERGEQLAKNISEVETDVIRMLVAMSTKSESVENMRKLMTERGWILPDNATATAISEICKASAFIMLHGPGNSIMPGTIKVDSIQSTCELLGFQDYQELKDEINAGILQKNITDVARILKGDLQDEEFKGGIGMAAILGDIQTRDAKLDLDGDEEDKDYLEIEDNSDSFDDLSDNMESEDEEEIKDMVGGITANQKARFLMPLKYSSRFTYKVVYYILMNRSKIQLAFGRTLPNTGFTYAVMLLCDPNNDYGLRYDPKAFMLKIGGVGLLEKSIYFENTSSAVFRRCYKATSSSSSDLTAMKNITTNVYTLLARMTAKRNSYAELKDSLIDLQNKIDSDVTYYFNVLNSNGLADSLLFKQRSQKLSKRVSNAKSIAKSRNALQKMIANELNLYYSEEDDTVKNELEYLSYGAVYMAEAMSENAEKHFEGIADGTEWFILGYSRFLSGVDGYFNLIRELFEQERNAAAIIDFLFPVEKDRVNVKKALHVVKKMFEDQKAVSVSRILARIQKKTDESPYLAWSNTVANQVLAENRQVHQLVKSAIEKDVEAGLAGEDRFGLLDLVADVKAFMTEYSKDGVHPISKLVLPELPSKDNVGRVKMSKTLNTANFDEAPLDVIAKAFRNLGISGILQSFNAELLKNNYSRIMFIKQLLKKAVSLAAPHFKSGTFTALEGAILNSSSTRGSGIKPACMAALRTISEADFVSNNLEAVCSLALINVATNL